MSSPSDYLLLQEDLNKLYAWCQKWQISLNTSKCKVMCISLKKLPPHFNYQINNISLDWVDNFKYLGITINKKLTWSSHVLETSSKAFALLNFKENYEKLQQSCKHQSIYSSGTLEYATPVWSLHETKMLIYLKKFRKEQLDGCVELDGLLRAIAGPLLTFTSYRD